MTERDVFIELLNAQTALVQRMGRVRSPRKRERLAAQINANLARARILRHAPEVHRRMMQR